ncbi:MAG: 30S ribosome-binding factor RbfA [Candidatus Dormibacteraeota bacterium]|nr:30S ribosome-binding factor RbfA [Candidatus Dormibacteraeota bacterium]MBV9525733.1 30S ribosome-binding factor RbfA [Candidatus Dormibacteraeota bacterium]
MPQKPRPTLLPEILRSTRAPRRERVAEQLREEISQVMMREMKDPRVRLASVSSVRVSADLREARVMVSALGSDEERHEVVAAMRHAEGFVRAQLGERLENLRTIPRLRFELDESIAYSVRISAMLRDIERGQVPGEEAP